MDADIRPIRQWPRQLTLGATLGLILFYTAYHLWLREQAPLVLPWLLSCLPLAAFLPALARGSLRAYQWLGFVILIYFVNGVLRAFTPGQGLAGGLETALSVLVFVAAVSHAHALNRRR